MYVLWYLILLEMKEQVKIFLTAVMFYTRIPCPTWVDHSPDYINKCTKYFPLIGWIVGIVFSISFLIFNYLFNVEIAIVLSILATILTTGAFHEDGFADVCDGFGGGWTKEKILEIMKDSRVGTYGAVGLLINLILKFFLILKLSQITNSYNLIFIFISAHALSRLMAIGIIYFGEYAREDASSKVKPIAVTMSKSDFMIAIIIGITPFLILIYSTQMMFLGILIPMILFVIYLKKYFEKWIGGYTGDCLGCTQQVTEIVFYLIFLAIWKFI